MSSLSAITMMERYSRAVHLTAPRVAADLAGNAVDGYWIDDDLFFFLMERFDQSMGRMTSIPSIADCKTDTVDEIISIRALADLISTQSTQTHDLEAFSSALLDVLDQETLGIRVGGWDYLIDIPKRQLIEARQSLEVPALYSPDGRYACVVKGYDLWLVDRITGEQRALTSGGERNFCFGCQSEAALSAISYRERPSPMGLWSPDSQWFLTHRIDERAVPDLALVQHAPPGGGRPILHTYKYPMPGDPLPVATFLAIHIASGRVVTFDDFATPVLAFSPFVQRRVWFGTGGAAWFVRLDRHCKQAELIQLDLAQGTGRVVVREAAAEGYIDLNPHLSATPNVRTLAASDEVIWFSERDGWGHLYLYDASTGAVKNQVTAGDWLVRDIIDVDETRRKITILAGGIDPEADPGRRSLCSVNFDGSGFQVLLTHAGDIYLPATEPSGLQQDRPFRPSNSRPGISPDSRFGLVRYSSTDKGDLTEIVDLQTRRGFTIASALPAPDEALPRHFTALAADGTTRLHGIMLFPSDFNESQCYPLIDYIYPGPQVWQQPQSFRSIKLAPAKALAELGFVTIMLDTRGTPVGSRAFHQAGYGALLEPQLADHAAVVRQLCERHAFIDGKRVGMIGSSGGGAATARALCDYGEIFHVGVAASGNHDSSFYSTIWSDKYRGPDGAEAWAEQAGGAVANKLRGKLLLIAGDMDENVHFSQTLALADALIRANKDFDLLIVPNAGHNVLLANGYAQRRAWDYFVRNLLCEVPPPNFEISYKPHELACLGSRLASEARQ